MGNLEGIVNYSVIKHFLFSFFFTWGLFFFSLLFLARGDGRKKGGRERHVDVREQHRLVSPPTHPDWGSNPQATYVPWLAIGYRTMLQPAEPQGPGKYFWRACSRLAAGGLGPGVSPALGPPGDTCCTLRQWSPCCMYSHRAPTNCANQSPAPYCIYYLGRGFPWWGLSFLCP